MRRKTKYVGGYQSRLFLFCVIIAFFLTSGCAHRGGQVQISHAFMEANNFFDKGQYTASIRMYEQITDIYPAMGDRAFFEMGMVYAFPANDQKDYRKSQECFQKVIRHYPGSKYRQDSMMMIFYIGNLADDAKRYLSQQKQIELLGKEITEKENEINDLEKRIESLGARLTESLQGCVDKILIEKKERKMTLFSKGRIFKTYKIALGGNPEGPKVRQGDNKTPEGIYYIDSRKNDSLYHLALRLSYPNEKDIKRAKKLGVSPGGDIMIHGIKNGYSRIGGAHSNTDWTQGCIAVTNEEIEEIATFVPIGTKVEIRP